MFLVDDILLAPFKGLAAVCRQVRDAARQELEGQKKDVMATLAELHKRLESGQIDERQFDVQEARLLEQLESRISKYDASSMRVISCAGAPLPTSIKEGVIDFFDKAGLYEHYGSTEASVVTLLKPSDQLRKIRCAGKPFWGVEVKLLNTKEEQVSVDEVGEIFIKSPYMMDGYHKGGREGFVGEWFASGDLAKQDEEGYFYIVDRMKDMIISGGENIYPAEIEDVLYSNPKILEVAVIGIPDERWGESVKALMVLNDGQTSNQDEIIEYCRKRLAGFKIPASVSFVPELPKNTSGKILKWVLREEYWKDREIKV